MTTLLRLTMELSSAYKGEPVEQVRCVSCFLKSLSDLEGKCTETTLAQRRFSSPKLPQKQFLMIQKIRLSGVVQKSCSHFMHFYTGKKEDKYIAKLVFFKVFY